MAEDPWAAFRQPAQAAATEDPWAAFRQPVAAAAPPASASDRPSVALDVSKSAPTGLAKGAIGLAGLPNTVMQAADDYVLGPVARAVVRATGRTPASEQGPDTRGSIASGFPSAERMQRGVETVTGPLYKPQTTAGEYAQTIGEFAPGAAVGPGGLVRKIMETVVPAAASETAGQATKGTAAEPAARLVAAVMGNVGTAAVAARADAPARAIRTAAARITPEQLDTAEAVAATGQRIGVPLTGPEAIQQATGGATKLADVQRFVEGSPQSARLSEMMAARPAQMRTAAEQTFDTVAPQSAQPSTLGPRAAETAAGALDEVRQGINATTGPAYRAAGQHVLDPADFDPIARDPAFQASLRRLRGDEVLGPTYRDQPDNAVAVIDAVTKDMRDRGVALGNAANPGFSAQTAGLYGSGATEARAIARDPARGGVQAYDDALTAQSQARQQNLAPLEQGPLGAVSRVGAGGAGTRSGTQAAAEAILPSSPLAGGEGELVDAIRRMAARDGEGTAQLVRQRLADQADASMTRLVGGEAQGGGAKFAKDIAGTRQQATNLDAVLGALPESPRAQQAVADLIEAFRATGTRKPQGSPTDFNAQYRAEIGGETLPQQAMAALRTQGRSLFANVNDGARRAYLGKNNGRLADLFASPDSVAQIRAIAARGGETPFVDVFMRSAVQAPSAANNR